MTNEEAPVQTDKGCTGCLLVLLVLAGATTYGLYHWPKPTIITVAVTMAVALFVMRIRSDRHRRNWAAEQEAELQRKRAEAEAKAREEAEWLANLDWNTIYALTPSIEVSVDTTFSQDFALQTTTGEEVHFRQGDPLVGEVSVFYDLEDPVAAWFSKYHEAKNMYLDAVESLIVQADIQNEGRTLRYRGHIWCSDVHFREGERMRSRTNLVWGNLPSLADMFDGRDMVPIIVDGEEVSVYEKYMGSHCMIQLDPTTLHVQNVFYDSINISNDRIAYYSHPIDSILFKRQPKFSRHEGQIEEVALHDGPEAILKVVPPADFL